MHTLWVAQAQGLVSFLFAAFDRICFDIAIDSFEAHKRALFHVHQIVNLCIGFMADQYAARIAIGF